MSARPIALHPLLLVAAGLAGNAMQLRQARLDAPWVYLATIAVGAGLAVLAWRWRLNARWIVAAAALAALMFGSTGWRASQQLAQGLDPALEGVDIVLTGVVDGLPRVGPDGIAFAFDVESAQLQGRAVVVPSRVSLGWYAEPGDDAALPRVAAADRWRLTVRLRRPHGLMNPHGFDFELWLFERGIGATGAVRPAPVQRLGTDAGRFVERGRQAVRDAIEARVRDPKAAGLLAALAVGDQSAIDRPEWDLYRITGVAHLMSISGLHVTMFAWLAAAAVGALWRRSYRACLWCPTPTAARVGGLMFAAGYALFAGWGVPAQRTVWMLAAVVALQWAGLRWPWPLTLAAAGLVVVIIDPWAWLQPGFWLSFAAVGMLMAGGSVAQAASQGSSRVRRVAEAAFQGLRTQAIATIGLAPLSLVFFNQLSLVGFAANVVAIPLVTLLITPLALLGVVLAPLWSVAALAIDAMHALLAALAGLPTASWSVPVAPWWAQAAGLLAGAIAIAPLPWRARLLALPMALPLLAPTIDRPAEGHVEVVAVDVGQGTAVLVRTRSKLLVFDTGPAYARERNAGERVLLPLLRARGEARIDALVLSHQDLDHVGGAAALIDALPVAQLWSSLHAAHPLRLRGLAHRRCEAGASWRWDGVEFVFLHPATDGDESRAAPKPNAVSCVLRVTDAQGRAALITGDIEAPQEQALLASGAPLRAHTLVVAHHGSRTSSTAAWLDAVAPEVAVIQAGYRNRYGHPAALVEQRLTARGMRVVRSDTCGAFTIGGDVAMACERDARQRYWHHGSGRSDDAGGDHDASSAAARTTPLASSPP